MYPVNSAHQFLRARIFQEVTQGACFDGWKDLVISGKAGQHQDTCLGLAGCDVANGLDAIHLGHHQIHQDDVGLEPFRLGDRLSSVFCLPHNLNVRLCRQQSSNPLTDDHMIVGD